MMHQQIQQFSTNIESFPIQMMEREEKKICNFRTAVNTSSATNPPLNMIKGVKITTSKDTSHVLLSGSLPTVSFPPLPQHVPSPSSEIRLKHTFTESENSQSIPKIRQLSLRIKATTRRRSTARAGTHTTGARRRAPAATATAAARSPPRRTRTAPAREGARRRSRGGGAPPSRRPSWPSWSGSSGARSTCPWLTGAAWPRRSASQRRRSRRGTRTGGQYCTAKYLYYF
ncbi:hypothetical protein CEXT_178161 [Caerostris extrusa]|uniref:Uncharacterized protein n=1 Tax=Caerostris extrusa TaxID=172846 RepID=A0AAV4XXD9_CAEEX|nr:hypothetical protein CEXT_178161 [Caerostris extrusa]